MKYIEIPETVKISGREAIQSLNDYINELEQQKNKELTKKQKTAMIKFARGLVASIEDEMQRKATRKQTGRVSIMKQVKEAILKGLEFGSTSDDDVRSVRAKSTVKPNLKLDKDIDN